MGRHRYRLKVPAGWLVDAGLLTSVLMGAKPGYPASGMKGEEIHGVFPSANSINDGQGCTPDPLGYTEPLPLAEHFCPLGFPLVLKSNSTEILEAGRASWGEFEPAFEAAPIELRVAVQGDEDEPARTSTAGPAFRGQGHLLAVTLTARNFAVCDLDRGLGFACLTPGVARNHLYTAFHFLDAVAYLCLCHQHLTPIHGACVAARGQGILLVGQPGAGKSSLAWACARAGLTFVSDDATWLPRRQQDLTLIGKPQRLRFRPEALQLFPELARLPRLETVIGKHSFEIRTASMPGLTTARCCRPGKILFLDRRTDSSAAELYPIGAQEARRRLAEATTLYEPQVWQEQEASRERLLRVGALGLRYSSLGGAVEQILKLAAGGIG